jgi:hypothetical protein
MSETNNSGYEAPSVEQVEAADNPGATAAGFVTDQR